MKNCNLHIALFVETWHATSLHWRGYTGHEHLQQYGLINMNARLYDPALGRFLSPDPYIQDPTNRQNFNRYSYCLNNPLKYTDQTGETVYKYNKLVGWYFDEYGRAASQEDFLDWQYGFGGKHDFYDPSGVSYGTSYGAMWYSSYAWSGSNTAAAAQQNYKSFLEIARMLGVNSYTDKKGYTWLTYATVQTVQGIVDFNGSLRIADIYEWNFIAKKMSMPSNNLKFNSTNELKFNIDAAIIYLNTHAYPKYDKETCGNCARAVRLSLEAGGINTKDHPVPARLYGSYLENWGFSPINTVNYQKGDIAVIQGYPGGTADKNRVPYGHIQMYNGSKWVSDYIQNRPFWPGKGYETYSPKFQIYRW